MNPECLAHPSSLVQWVYLKEWVGTQFFLRTHSWSRKLSKGEEELSARRDNGEEKSKKEGLPIVIGR